MDRWFGIAVVLIAAIVAAGFINSGYSGYAVRKGMESRVDHTGFAQCLTRSNVVLYAGTDQASREQTSMFGKGASYLDIVDCQETREICEEAGVKITPTWRIHGKKYAGTIPLGSLSDLTGCRL
jgi:hypothetical protein